LLQNQYTMTIPFERQRIPIFPLNTVLFPGKSMPLQIFEPRYKTMIEYCINTESHFGIVLIKSGRETEQNPISYSVGTLAKITSVKNYLNDRFLITINGTQTFNIIETFSDNQYLTADVSIHHNKLEPVNNAIVKIAKNKMAEYIRYIIGLSGGWVSNEFDPTPSHTANLCYFMAESLELSLKQKQTILEETSDTARLSNCMTHLEHKASAISIQLELMLIYKFSRQ
jgi:Lon protease-like protein